MQVNGIHRTGCDVWSVPDQHAFVERDCPDDATAAYLTAVAPAYNALLRVTGQLGSHLLLSQHRTTGDLEFDHEARGLVRDRLAESEEHLSTVPVPRAAARHFWAIGRTAVILRQALACMERFSGGRDSSLRLRLVSDSARLLNTAYRLLQLTSRPHAGLSTVDLEHACCSCADRRRQ